jgi:hypothetical protein
MEWSFVFGMLFGALLILGFCTISRWVRDSKKKMTWKEDWDRKNP